MNFKNINKIELNDIKAIFILICAFLPSLYIRFKKHLWLICERKDNAQDNAWIFFKWLKKEHPEQHFYFVLDKHAPSFDSNDSRIIKWGSFKHYIYYMASKTFIKAMFNGPQPSGRICYYYEKYFDKKQTAYLRHGIAKDGCEHHRYENLKVRLFICGARPEYDYFLENAGYPDGYLQYTGFARYDDLIQHQSTEDSFILIMPTWRRYLCESANAEENEQKFIESSFYKQYTSLLTSSTFLNFINTHSLKVKFCLHAEFRRFEHLFNLNIPNIEFVKVNESIHHLLKQASLLVTDYSSVFFDVAYMYKPLVYYHFDYEEFRAKHLSEGYFSYKANGFGAIAYNVEDLVKEITACHNDNGFHMPDEYKQRVDAFFPKRDNKNCERIYNAILQMENSKN